MNDRREQVLKEFERLRIDLSNTLVLPIATIIETGNHIAQISDGNVRRAKAEQMAKMLDDMINGEAPWVYFEEEITSDDLLRISKHFPEMAMREIGMGDLSIISAYNKYKDTRPAIGYIRIWSTDGHLASHEERITIGIRRRKR